MTKKLIKRDCCSMMNIEKHQKNVDDVDVETESFTSENGLIINPKGFNWLIAGLFVIGEMAGSGIIALPEAINLATYYVGIGLILWVSFMATCSAVLLGKAWVFLLELYPVYRKHCRKPYAELSYQTGGPLLRKFVSICLIGTQIFASTCFVLVIARNVSNFLLNSFGTSLSYCWLILIVGVFICPLTLFGSPSEFWIVIVLGMLATAAAVVLIIIGAFIDNECAQKTKMPDFSWQNLLFSIGTILFTLGGHSCFPTIQHDMRKPSDFSKSAVFAFIIIALLNLTVGHFGVKNYGSSLHTSIIESIQTPFIQQSVTVLIALHCLLTSILLLNPLFQQVEDYYKVNHAFGMGRIFSRFGIIFIIIFLAESVPSFNKYINFVGGCLLTITSLIFPPIFYLFISAKKNMVLFIDSINNNNKLSLERNNVLNKKLTIAEVYKHTNKFSLILCILILATGIIFGTIATVISATDILSFKLNDAVPCYVAYFGWFGTSSTIFSPEKLVTICCNQSITSNYINSSELTCRLPNPNFYNRSALLF